MDILIDNKNLATYFGIVCLDYTGLLTLAAERENERVWADKSGVDKNLVNIRYDAREFVLKCYVKASNIAQAYNVAKTLTTYMYNQKVFIVSLRDAALGVREFFLCERSGAIVPDISIRQQNSLYVFKLGLKDVNPNALKFANTVESFSTEILYNRGKNAVLYWGDGTRQEVTNSYPYTKTDYLEDGPIDIIIDVDSNTPVMSVMSANFTADVTEGVKPQTVNFGDLSVGTPVIWAWNFGDGTTSSEQNPTHVYTQEGTYTVTLQIYNEVQGTSIHTKTNYITIRNARMLVSDSGDFALSGNGFGNIN